MPEGVYVSMESRSSDCLALESTIIIGSLLLRSSIHLEEEQCHPIIIDAIASWTQKPSELIY